jgi:hypothetical protein
VHCEIPDDYTLAWHVLQGHGIVQPNTYSPDGQTTYVTSMQPDPDGCTVHALDVETGDTRWCHAYGSDAANASVEVDEDGNLYFTSAGVVVSLDAEGDERWSTMVGAPTDDGRVEGAFGVHFSPDGFVVTSTEDGTVWLLDRGDGSVLTSLSIPDAYGFVPPAEFGGGIDLSDAFPDSVTNDMLALTGSAQAFADFTSRFLGAGGGFSDNTVGVTSRNEIYAVGGGPDEDHGAMVQLRIDGTPDAPVLTAGWSTPFLGGSATSPSITEDGSMIVIGDGQVPLAILQDTTDARMLRIDVDACDANEDADSDPTICAAIDTLDMVASPMAGSPAILPDGSVIHWELSFRDFVSSDIPDLRAFDGELLWQTELPDEMSWTSVITVTDDRLVGTGSRFTASEHALLTMTLPGTGEHDLLVLDRADGSVVFRHPITDDASATVTVGPYQGLYVGMLGLLNILAVDTRPTWGLMKFSPAEP